MLTDKESANAEDNDLRLQQIKLWIESDLKISSFQIDTASADASFRRYFRVSTKDVHGSSFIIMDAPPDKEDCRPFINIARLIESAGVHAPHIYEFNQAQGFMRLSDLGSTAYLDKLTEDTADELYLAAIQAIVKMQTISSDLPAYDAALLHTEMSLFKDWYLNKHLAVALDNKQNEILTNTFSILVENALQQTSVFVHRDYHSRNLMITNENNPGVIDFQDAVTGSVSYDLVSLIKDCYISWPRNKQLEWIELYIKFSPLEIDKERFIKQVDLMGMQRHLKAIGIFARLNYRDAKPNYMHDIPRTLAYVFDVCERYAELSDFSQLLSALNIQADEALLSRIK